MATLDERARQGSGATAARPLPEGAAAAIVFCASGAVLVLEILAVRLLAPYVGLTLEAYTSIIGVVLAGIAAGSWVGGRLADRVAPRRVIGPLLIAGGALAMLVVPVVRGLGDLALARGQAVPLLLTVAAFLPPAAVLSAVTPTVAKLQLDDLGATGSVVGRLSAWATAGALVGTFATGFVLVPLAPTPVTVLVIGGLLIVAGAGLAVWLGGAGTATAATALAGALVLGAGGVAAGSPCERESVYYCARVDTDPARSTGRVLVLDDLRHSYVDLADPGYLGFAYTRWIARTLAVLEPPPAPLEAVFIGGGGFTLPRWLLETRPGSRATVLEVDRQVVELARERLGLRPSPALTVRVGDARALLRRRPASSADVVVGDAFSSLSVPWHLTTSEFLRDVRRVLRADGTYMVNVIDHGPLELARGQAATLLAVFGHVALVGRPGGGPGGLDGGNLVLVAADRPLALGQLGAGPDLRVLARAAVVRFAGGTKPLTDDRAPADQLLTPPG